MDPLSGSPQSPPPGYTGGVWPPPPSSSSNEARLLLIVPFKTQFQRMDGSVPDFRTGNIQLSDNGLGIYGQAISPYERQVPILTVTMLFGWLFIAAYFYYEYAYRKDASLNLYWQDIRHLVVLPEKRVVCIVYNAPNYKGIVKPYSLTFKLEPALFNEFTAIANHHMGDRILTRRLRPWTSPPVWVFLGGLLVSMVIAGITIAFDQMGLTR